jgi:hypothetical protein
MRELIGIVTATAAEGVGRYYRQYPGEFPYTVRADRQGGAKPQGYSIRYAAISQIGISRWLKHHPNDGAQLPDLQQKVSSRIDTIDDVGDAALWVWASCEGGHGDIDRLVSRLVHLWKDQSAGCNAVELAWVVKACAMVYECEPDRRGEVEAMMREAETRLRQLFSSESNLFRRHARGGYIERIGGRIACFADQVYPIVAYAHYGTLFEDAQALRMAEGAVETICRLQGPLGQWWWHYDTVTGRVCEGYPVFSVHQHSMAPMAILSYDRIAGRDHGQAMDLGLRWITGRNELEEDLVDRRLGIIWRDIERREPLKMSRVVRAASCTIGLKSLHTLAGKLSLGWRVNRECRPYELGWILYAWADYDE